MGLGNALQGPVAIHAASKDPMCLQNTVELGEYAVIAGISQWDGLLRGAIIAIAEHANFWHIVHHPGVDVDAA